jgi:hypothetical protein
MGSMPQGRPCRQPGSPTAQVPPWVARFLARFDATIAVTLDTYSHVLPNMQRDAVERLGALLK